MEKTIHKHQEKKLVSSNIKQKNHWEEKENETKKIFCIFSNHFNQHMFI